MRRLPRPPLGLPRMGPPGLGLMPPPRPPHGMGPLPMQALGLPPMPPPMGPPGPLAPVSSSTNSKDPISMDSRLFVGNLNTIALSKEAVEAIFSRYGLVTGVSMHKGYAFVQFSHPDEARRAGANEDGKLYAGQLIDINIVSQPKNRNALKRPTGGRSSDVPVKKSRTDSNPSLQRTLVTLSGSGIKKAAANSAVRRAIATANRSMAKRNAALSEDDDQEWPDVLICGHCKMQFSSLEEMADHKMSSCVLRVSSLPDEAGDAECEEPACLLCANCDAEFKSAWALCQHYEEVHKMKVAKIKEEKLVSQEDKSTNGKESDEENVKEEEEQEEAE